MKAQEKIDLLQTTFKPIYSVGDYIAPIQKSIFCELNNIGVIISVNKHTYTVKTKNGLKSVHIQFQELYRSIIPNKHEKINISDK